MRSAQDGDADAYRRLLSEIAPVVGSYVRQRFANPAWTDDCVQEVLMTIHQARHSFDPNRAFEPWLFTIVRHKAIDTLRRYKVHANRESTGDDVLESVPMPRSGTGGEQMDASSVIESLEPRYRRALLLTKVEGCTVEEAAKREGISHTAMRSRVSRAIARTKKKLLREAL